MRSSKGGKEAQTEYPKKDETLAFAAPKATPFGVADQEYEIVGIGSLKPHPKNPRRGDVGAIEQSIKSHGFVGAIKAQKSTGHILAGNHSYKAAVAAGMTEIPVIWLDVDNKEAVRIMLDDNAASDKGAYDRRELSGILAELANEGTLHQTLYTSEDLSTLITGLTEQESKVKDNPYSRKIKAPTYEIKGECPEVEAMVNTTKMDALVHAINQVDLPSDVAAFLRLAATRHAVFDYGRIAEFYAHSPVEIQDLMEDSALVIIDFDKALENGFVMITEELRQIYELEKDKESQDDDAE